MAEAQVALGDALRTGSALRKTAPPRQAGIKRQRSKNNDAAIRRLQLIGEPALDQFIIEANMKCTFPTKLT